jgi:peptidyl-prolyl cis-trans isomerase C
MTLRRSTILFASLLTLNTAVLAAPAAKVNDTTISDQEVEQVVRSNPALAQSPQGKQIALDSLINAELLYQQAKAQHLEEETEVKSAVAAATRQILINAATARYLRGNAVSDAALRERYNKMVQAMPKDKDQYQIRHIMVKTREEADTIRRQLKRGTPFAELATQSLDVNTARKGGELGWVFPSTLVPEVRAEVEKMRPGQLSAPIQTAQGWDVLEVMDKHPVTVPAFETVKEQVRAQLQQEALQRYLAELRNKANVTITAQPPKPSAGSGGASQPQPTKPSFGGDRGQ